jgi:hypothetical protein
VLLEDHFATLRPDWGDQTEELFARASALNIRPEADSIHWAVYAARFSEVDYCATITPVETIDPAESFVGLMFWYQDDDNFYALEIDAEGHASVWERLAGEWHAPADWRSTDLLIPGDGLPSQLRVVAKGDGATFYLNGQLFGELFTPAPANAQIGIIAASPATGVATYSVSDLFVTMPE